jgi:gluconate 2-dehydrogenase gamma chain
MSENSRGEQADDRGRMAAAEPGDERRETVPDREAPEDMDRRAVLKTLASTAIALPVLGASAPPAPAVPSVHSPSELVAPPGPRGTAWDPDLVRPRKRWTNKLSAAELVTLSALCDMIIPADSRSPSASAVGVPAYINEVVSAPYDWAEQELVRIRGGLAWLNTESRRRFSRTFARCTNAQRTAICDDICHEPKAAPELKSAAKFFDRIRDLTAEGFYTTDAGMKDIGYVGNVALPKFEGPPPAVLKHLGLT